MATQKYISIYTGAEIDQAITEMRGALSASNIVNDFSGGTTKVASAELAKILKGMIDTNNQPSNIKTQLLSVPDTHVLTDAEYAALGHLGRATSFRGSYNNAAARDTALTSEYVSYVGNEVTFIYDDGSGDSLSEFSRWNPNTLRWEKIQLYNAAGTPPQTIATASAYTLFSYRQARYNTMKALVSVSSADGTQRQIQEALITYVGTDTYISVYNEVGNASNLFNLTTSIASGYVNLIVNTTAANLVVTGRIIAMI